MKFIILLAIIGIVVCPPTKEELLKRATDLEAKLETEIEKVRTAHPQEAKILETEERELKTLAGELETAKSEAVIAHLEQRLNATERRVEEVLRRIEGHSGRPTRGTAAPTTAAY